MKPIYLDYHASTPVDPRVLQAMLPYFTQDFGNPSSSHHAYGWTASSAVHDARLALADLVGARSPDEIVFTSGATESNNLALRGVIEATGGRHIITSQIEHPCVLETCSYLESKGVDVTRVGVGADGIVSVDEVAAAIRPDTALISIMAVNNEVGTIQPISEIAELANERGAIFHTDAAQALGRVPLGLHHAGVHLASLSAHKVYGPKGVGALYVRQSPQAPALFRQMHGAAHERGRRAGTLNVPGIVGFGAAAKLASDDEEVRLAELRDRLLSALETALPGLRVNGSLQQRVGCNLNFSIDGVRADSVVHGVSGVAISGGAACSSGKAQGSHVLRAMGVPNVERGALRVSLGRMTTKGEVDQAAQRLIACIQRLL